MKITLLGNPNSGKTTLFNLLTGASAHVGNFPGVTVEVLEGKFGQNAIFDIPGTYSLSTYSHEEEIAVEKMLDETDVLVDIIDGNSLARGLYLAMQVLEMNKPTVLAINMMDQVEKNGGKIDCAGLSKILKVPVIPISAKKEKNIDKLLDAISNVKGTRTEKRSVEQRYEKIDYLCRKCFIQPKEKKSVLDTVLTGKITGVISFVLILFAIFFLTFFVIGPITADLIEALTERLSVVTEALLFKINVSTFFISLVTDGILSGVGSVLAFLPCIVLLTFFLSLLEDTGYMARIAFIMDAPMRFFGFSGKAIIPLFMGMGCSVPAIMACRTLTSNRKNTAIALPFISCPARLPVYMMLACAFFKKPLLIIIFIYLLGIICALLCGKALKKEDTDFLLEIPPYRFPKIKNVLKDVFNRTADFFSRAFGIILIASVIVFLFSNLDFSLKYSKENSILFNVSKAILPVFKPLGITSWELVASLIAGISAKEAIISSFGVLGVTTGMFTVDSAISFLVFCALYTPCIATIAILKKEYGIKSAIFSAGIQFAVAFIIAFLIKNAFILL